MSDLVELLREAAQSGREIIEPWQMDPNLYDEAAARIEALEAALREVMYHIELDTQAREVVRDALAEGQDK